MHTSITPIGALASARAAAVKKTLKKILNASLSPEVLSNGRCTQRRGVRRLGHIAREFKDGENVDIHF